MYNALMDCYGSDPCIGTQCLWRHIICNYHQVQKRVRHVCSMCFEKEGGHFFKRKGRGAQKKQNKTKSQCADKHVDDKTKSLEIFGQWIISTGHSTDEVVKNILI